MGRMEEAPSRCSLDKEQLTISSAQWKQALSRVDWTTQLHRHPDMSHKASVKIRFKRSLSSRTDSINSSTPMSISCSPASSTSASPSASERTAWWLQQSSSETSSQESVCQELIRKNVDKLGQLAEKCERLNSNLDKVVVESHKILDNSFLASQTHLTNHVTNLNYGACLDIGTAIDTYSEYVEAVQDLVEAEEDICVNMLQRLEKMNVKSQQIFQKATESKYHLCGDSDSEYTDDDDLLDLNV